MPSIQIENVPAGAHRTLRTRAAHAGYAGLGAPDDTLTPYDAAHVALAEALDAPLLRADARLGRGPGLPCAVEVLGPRGRGGGR